jgi:hypothetical protein
MQNIIEIKNVKVISDVQNGVYKIELSLRIPNVNENLSITSILSQDGYHVL